MAKNPPGEKRQGKPPGTARSSHSVSGGESKQGGPCYGETCYRAIVEAFEGLIYICSRDYRIEFMNGAFIERIGRDATGELCYRALHGLDHVCSWCVNDQVFRGEIVRMEVKSPKDGRWYYILNSPIQHPDGTVSKQAMILDVTARKTMEEFLASKRQILEMIAKGRPLQETLDAINRMIEYHAPGTSSSIFLLNTAGTHLFQVSAPNLPQGLIRKLDGIAISRESHACARAAALGESVIIENIEEEDDGNPLCRETIEHGFLSCWCVPVRNRTDKVLGTFALFHRRARHPSKDEIKMLETAAYLAGIAIERREWEAELEQSERHYRSLFEESRDAIYITSRSGDFIDVNQATLELFGYTREELIGKITVGDLYVYPEQRELFKQAIEELGAVRDYEVIFRRKDGTAMDCLLTASVRQSAEGMILGYQGIIRDVTPYKRAEKRLRKSEARYRRLFEDSPIGLLEMDISALRAQLLKLRSHPSCDFGAYLDEHPSAVRELASLSRIVDANKAALELYQARTHEDLCPGLCAIFGEEPSEIMKEGLASIAAHRTSFKGEAMTPTIHGEMRDIAFRWSLLEAIDDRSSRLLVSVVDISRLKALERERTNLTAMFAHDMKSALTVIQGFVMRLLNKTLDIGSQKREQYLNIIRKEAAKLEFMVDDFLEFSRLQAGALPMDINSTSLDRELQELLETYMERARQVGIKLNLQDLESLPVIEADARRLRRVFANLLDNAFKFSRADSTITIQAQEQQDHVVIRFIDQGVGIDAEDLPYIFDPFHRGKDVTHYEGYGVGLAAVKSIVEAHGGRVLVESKAMRGSTFTVILPKKIPEPDRCQPSSGK